MALSFGFSSKISNIIFKINSSTSFLLLNWHNNKILDNFSIMNILLIILWDFLITQIFIKEIKSYFV